MDNGAPQWTVEDLGWTIDEMEADASRISGLTAFGPPSYRDGLARLLLSYRDDAGLTGPQAASARERLVDLLVRRLKTQAHLDAFTDGQPVAAPWVILGMPRCGTTALHRMLCADPDSQGLEHWLGLFPQPRPPRSEWPGNADFRAAEARLQTMRALAPALFAQHGMHADEVDECHIMMTQEFASGTFMATAKLPGYEEWLRTYDLSEGYRRHRAILSMIDNGKGRRWILKDPSHLGFLDNMLAIYPDMKVIFPRRAATEFLPSLASLLYEAHRLADPAVKREDVGRRALASVARTAHRILAWRSANPDVPWFEFDQKDMRADPIGVARSLYDAFGAHFSPAAQTAMEAILKRGLHAGASAEKPQLETFGLSRQALADVLPAEFV